VQCDRVHGKENDKPADATICQKSCYGHDKGRYELPFRKPRHPVRQRLGRPCFLHHGPEYGSNKEDKKFTQALGEDAQLPNPYLAAIPPILILVLFNVVQMPVEGAVLAGILTAIVLFRNYGGDYQEWVGILNRGAMNSAPAILNTAIVVGFAGVVRGTVGFEQIISMLKDLQMSPLLLPEPRQVLEALLHSLPSLPPLSQISREPPGK